VSCQLFAGLYPHVIAEQYRKYGYIWGVYVEPPHRGQGLPAYWHGARPPKIAQLHTGDPTRLHWENQSTQPRLLESNEMRLDLI